MATGVNMPPKTVTKTHGTAPIGMDQFEYNAITVSVDWPRWIKRFEVYLHVQNIDRSQGPDAALALQHLLFMGGQKIFDIYDSIHVEDPPTTYAVLKTACTTAFTYTNPVPFKHSIEHRKFV